MFETFHNKKFRRKTKYIKILRPLCLEPDVVALKWDPGICIFTNALVQWSLDHILRNTGTLFDSLCDLIVFVVVVFPTQVLSTGLQRVIFNLVNTLLSSSSSYLNRLWRTGILEAKIIGMELSSSQSSKLFQKAICNLIIVIERGGVNRNFLKNFDLVYNHFRWLK